MFSKNRDQGFSAAWLVIGAMIATLVGVAIYAAFNKPVNERIGDGQPWNKNMVKGVDDAPNRFIKYTDYFCSFCAEVDEAIDESNFENNYVKSGKIRYENRVVTVLKEMSPNTEQGAEAALCAADQQKYWDYTKNIVARIKTDFFDKGIGVKNVASPVPIEKLPQSYFSATAEKVGMKVAEFESCMQGETHKKEIEENTRRALGLGVTGLPYMVVNDYSSSGFMGGSSGLDMVLKAGGVSQ